jgi:hypothetical protein
MAKPAAVVVNVATPPTLTLLWDYPADLLTNVVFQVFHAATLTNTPPITRYDQVPNNFTLLSVVDGYTSMVINRAYGAEFFIVRALDKVSGVFSNWNAP